MIGLFALALAATATPATQRIPVDVVSPETSAVSFKLTDALLKALDGSKRLRASGGDDEPKVKLAILAAKAPSDSRLDYMIDVIDSSGVAPHRLASLEGTCKASTMAECAASIVEKAQSKVKE